MANFPQSIGNYVLERQIGKGGSSHVWLARHRTLEDRLVAIKLVIPQDAEWEERFSREANITSRLRHESIIQIFDHGYHPPYLYTVMEYVPGGALRDLLKDRRPLPLELVVRIFQRAGAALDYAHAHGVVHRDVSPGNILIDRSSNRVVLTDFGIARESGKAGMTTVNKVMGTPGYLSPEHATSATAVTHLSDIYSLGVVLFEMLSGALPWDYTPGVADAGGGPFVPPMPLKARGVTSTPPEADTIIQTMLALDPAKRYPSAQAAVEALDRVLRRHTSTTTIVSPGVGEAAGRPEVPATGAMLTPSLPPEPHPVEKVLALDLLKGPLQEARALTESLCDTRELAALLNRWSREARFRRPLLGRQALVRRVSPQNVYFYTLRVLYETREPEKTVEEPDYKAAPAPIEKILDRWGVELPQPKGFQDDTGGTLRLPGSTRVVACGGCSGVGRVTCPRCQGKQRITVRRDAVPAAGGEQRGVKAPAPVTPATGGAKAGAAGAAAAAPAGAATVVIPCPDCSGTGALRCQRCDGVSRLVQHKTITWRRRAAALDTNDDLPRVDERWLHRACAPREVYRERQAGDFRPEWQLVPALAELITEAEKGRGKDTRVAVSEVSISFIPVTEILFDLGETPPPPEPEAGAPAKGKGKPKPPPKPRRTPDAGLYRWHIYGFERRLPKDWRFLNWDRVAWAIMATALVAALLVAGAARLMLL